MFIPFAKEMGARNCKYLKQLAEQAGHPIDLKKLDAEKWNAASRSAHAGDYRPIQEMISKRLSRSKKEAF